jgi:hypothetical protein
MHVLVATRNNMTNKGGGVSMLAGYCAPTPQTVIRLPPLSHPSEGNHGESVSFSRSINCRDVRQVGHGVMIIHRQMTITRRAAQPGDGHNLLLSPQRLPSHLRHVPINDSECDHCDGEEAQPKQRFAEDDLAESE